MRIFLLFLLFFVTIDIYRRFNASTHLFHCRQLQAPKRLRLMDNEQFRCIFPTHYKNTQRARQQQQQQLKCETETESIKGKDRSRNKEREPKTEGKRNCDLASSAHEAKLMQPGDEKLQLAAARSYTHTHSHTGTQALPRSPSRTRRSSVFSTHSLSQWRSHSLCLFWRPGELHEMFWPKTTTLWTRRDCVLFAVVVSWPRCPQLSARCERNWAAAAAWALCCCCCRRKQRRRVVERTYVWL